MRTPTGTARVTLIAMFVALSLVIAQIPTPPHSMLKFSGFPVILSGLILGPAGGFAVGILQDLVGWVMHASGAYFPGFTLTAGLTGALPALILSRSKRPLPFVSLWLAIWFSQMLLKCGPVAYFQRYVFGWPWEVTASRYALEQTLHAPFYAWCALAVLRGWDRHQQAAE